MTASTQGESAPSVQRVGVVGAGAAGLVTARELERAGMAVTVFEASTELGGLWNYDAREAIELRELDVRRRSVRVHSPLYPSLRTNLPRRLMAFRDFAFDDLDSTGQRLEFPRHDAVRRYLLRFVEHFALARRIELNSPVEQLDPVEGQAGFVVRAAGRSRRFDAVAICNGHYHEPNVAILPGLDGFPGVVVHSHVYRGPAPFAGQRVVVVGAASSGLDLAHELSTTAARVFVSAFEPDSVHVGVPVEACAEVRSLQADGSVRLADGVALERIDVVVLCTGYRYQFPFLPEGLVQVAPGSVSPLFWDLLHVDYPRLAFVGLPFKVVPFVQFEIQAKLFARYLAGKLDVPAHDERRREHAMQYTQRAARGEHPRHALRHGAFQFRYYEKLARLIGEAPLPDWFEPLYDAVSEARRRHPRKYRDVDLSR